MGSADRAEVVGRLADALEAGHLAVADHDARIIAVGEANYASQLMDQLSDLPAEYAWLPASAVAPPPPDARRRSPGRAALAFGILSLPTSFCVLGGVFGVIAVVLSFRGERGRGFGPALAGRVLGAIGVVLSLAALYTLVVAFRAGDLDGS